MLFSSDSDSDMEVLAQLSDWDSTDSEEQRAPARRIKRVNYMQSLDDAEFTFRFRLNKSTVDLLLNEIMPHVRVTSTRNHEVSPLHQLLLTLRFYALGTMIISVADFVGVSKSTAGRIIRDISTAIARLYEKYIYMHTEGVNNFYEIAQFPRVLGAIDGTHIRLQSPCHLIGEEFRNRKGYFSLNVQAVCDSFLRFMNVVARWPGSTHDATIFNNSVLRAQLESRQFDGLWLLGDSAYPNRNYLLTPILNTRNAAEERYNIAHIKTRNTIERTFGVWKRRFPVVALTLRVSLPIAQSIIIATAVLHNICRNSNSTDEIPSEVDVSLLTGMEDDSNAIEETISDVQYNSRAELIENFFI